MIKVRVEVRNEIASFTVAVRAENLRQATRIARDLYPGSAVGIAFPIEPDGFFAAGPHQDGHVGLAGSERPGERQEPTELGLPGVDLSFRTEPSSGIRLHPEVEGKREGKGPSRLARR